MSVAETFDQMVFDGTETSSADLCLQGIVGSQPPIEYISYSSIFGAVEITQYYLQETGLVTEQEATP